MIISYSDFVSASKCRRRFWLNDNRLHKRELSDIACNYQLQHKQLLDCYVQSLDGFVRAGTESRVLPPQISLAQSLERGVAKGDTINIIGANINTVQYHAHIDILKKDSAGCWSFVMVKAASGIKRRYLEEAAFRLYILNLAGFGISDCRIVCVNKRYVKGAAFPPFIESSVFKEARQRLDSVGSQLLEMSKLLINPEPPEACLQRHCIKPSRCSHYRQCWPGLSEYNVLSIPHMSPAEREGLTQGGLVEINDLVDDENYGFSQKQRQYIQLVKNKAQKIDDAEIVQSMKALQYPLYFLDFEADNPALPKIVGQKAFMKIPFQFSCHRLTQETELSHYDYLHNSEDDPRPVLIEQLLNSIGEQGSVIVWHADFERSRLHELAHLMPEHREKLLSIVARLWDMELIFKHHYQDYRFKGSCSIKAIIKALLPDLSYDDLQVKDGEQVVAVWNCMLAEKNNKRRMQSFENIRAYCERDTLAMVVLYQHLQNVLVENTERESEK